MVRGDDSFPFGAGPIVNAMVIEEHMSGIDAWGVTECDDERKLRTRRGISGGALQSRLHSWMPQSGFTVKLTRQARGAILTNLSMYHGSKQVL
jgi:hypothetical protein